MEEKNKNGAPYGNQNAVGNNGGRPPIYDTENHEDIEKVKTLCEEYFEYIKGEYKEDEFEYEPGKFRIEKFCVRSPEPPTLTGLTLFLGFDCKQTLYNYAKKVEFLEPIKRALTKIEQFHEIATSMGDKCVGNIFILKNFGWKDSVQTDITTNGENINTAPIIKFVDSDDGD